MSNKIRLLHIISSMHQGGAENLLVQHIAQLGSDAYEHHVIYFHDGPCIERIADGVKKYHVRGLVWLYDPVWWYRLFKLVRSLRVDLMHTHLWAAHVAGRLSAWLFSIPLIATYHTPLLEADNEVRKYIDRVTMRFETVSCAVSTQVQATWKGLAATTTQMRWHTVPNGVDIQRFDAARVDTSVTRASLGIPDEAIVFGTVGRFIPSKRYDTLIDACAMLTVSYPQTYLVLVGWGQEEQMLKERVASRGIEDRVRFVIGKQAAPYYKLMDVFVLPSEREGMSMALLEAMASSLPVIVVHPEESQHDVVTHLHEGIVLPTNEPSMLASAMVHMLLFADEVARYKKTARATVERNFSFEKMRMQYEQMYRSVLNRK